MQQTTEAKSIKSYIEARQANWDKLAERFRHHRDFDESRKFQLDFYEHTFLTLFVKDALQKIASEHKELGINRIIFRGERFHYNWQQDPIGRYFIYDKHPNKKNNKINIPTPLASYENLIAIGTQKPTPLIIESSLNRFPRLQRAWENKTELEHKIDIVIEELHQDPNYIIVVPEKHIFSASQKYHLLSNSDYFVKEGGLITKLYTSEEEFRNEVRKAVEKNKLPLKT